MDLLKAQKAAALVLILGYIILIVSSEQSEIVELLRLEGKTISSDVIDPSKTSSLSSKVRIIGLLILALIASTRLKQRIVEFQSGSLKSPLTPNLFITAGACIGVIGIVLVAIGAQQRAAESGIRLGLV
ncbi:hypothetical protein [Fonticella tunisiensis]|uniref:hypothetical protein n=1 Tax=Fonticella tunisiensis TaxID=1096341 RepID=UPI00105E0BFB|nr:hypothetical protein [Fonticella tunisiensis]